MTIYNTCKSYFHGFQDLRKFNRNTAKKNIVAALKIISYCTLVVPLGFGVAYGLSKRAKHHPSIPRKQSQTIGEIAKTNLAVTVKDTSPPKQAQLAQTTNNSEPATTTKTKEECIQQLGLRATPLSAPSTSIRTNKELEQDLAQYDPSVCFKSTTNKRGEKTIFENSEITQKKVLDIATKLHNQLLYISYDQFKKDLESLTIELLQHLDGEKYAVGVAEGKSNTWVAEHAVQNLSKEQLPSATFKLELLESSENISAFEQMAKQGIKKVVIFDDVIYSGSQMKSHITRFIHANKKIGDMELIIVPVYTSKQFKDRFIKSGGDKFKLITTKTTLPTVEEAIKEDEIHLLNILFPQYPFGGHQHLTYADWKVADAKSVPEFLHCGLKLKEGIFRFMRSPEPLYPPYKNREELDCSYSFDHPFENESVIEFG